MLTEDYCDFETAKLLRDKGFDSEDCFAFYKKNGEIGFLQTFGDIADYDSETCVIAPTLQMAMKWLRKVHRICIVIMPVVTDDDGDAGCSWKYIISRKLEVSHKAECLYESYENALNDVIKYSLEVLI
jgi:hypothetical protein